MKNVTATTYLQVEPEWNRYSSAELEVDLRGAKIIASTQTRPKRQRPGTVLVKIAIQIPAGAFLPLRPEVTVVVPESMAKVEPIVVEAQEPSE